MAKSTKNSIADIYADLAEIGIESKPPPYEDLRAEGWISIADVSAETGKGYSTISKVLRKAVLEGKWEKTPATLKEGTTAAVFRKKV